MAALLAALSAESALATEVPATVSPGHSGHLVQVEGRCPTFNWGGVPGADSYQLVVYRLVEAEAGEEAQSVVLATVPGSVP